MQAKRKIIVKSALPVFIVVLLLGLCVPFLSFTNISVASANLCVSPEAWTTYYTGMYYGIGGVPNVVLDEVETYLGEASVRIDPAYSGINTGREANSFYTRVSPGDTIKFSGYIKTDESTLGDTDPNSGGRIGIDYYGASGRIGATQSPDGDPSWIPPGTWDDSTYLNYVNWGEDWTQVIMEFTVPDTFPADPWCASGYSSGSYYEPSAIIPWLQVWSSTYGASDGGSAYFANTELYINGEEVPLPAGAVFYDGFENGNFNAWNDTDVSAWAGSTLVVNSSSAYDSNYGAQLNGLTITDTGGYVEAILDKQPEFYFNSYYRFSSHLNDDTFLSRLMYVETATPFGDYMSVNLRKGTDSSSYYWQFSHSYETRSWTSSTFTMQPDDWYNIQLYVLDSTSWASNGAFKLYVNETEVLSQTGVRMGNVAGWETFRVGASQSVDASAEMIEFDEITISGSYIEPVVDTYVITNSITSPANTTYTTSTVPYEMFVVAGNDTVAGYQINAYYSNGTAVGVNQTSSTGSFAGLADGIYKFAVYVVGEQGSTDYDEVWFTVDTSGEPDIVDEIYMSVTVSPNIYFMFSDGVYLNFEDEQTFSINPYRIDDIWYFESNAINLIGANATVTKYFESNVLEFTLTGDVGVNSAFTIDTGSYGAPVEVSGASSWSFDTPSNTLTVLRSHSVDSAYTVSVSFVQSVIIVDLFGDGDIDLLLQYLLAGDLLGFIVACYTTRIGQVFYALIALIITVPLAIRTQSITYVAIIWILLGGLFQAAMPVISPVAVFLIILGVGSLLYRLFAGRHE